MGGVDAVADDDEQLPDPFARRDVRFEQLDDGTAQLRLVGPTDVIARVVHVLTARAQQLRDEQRSAAGQAAADDGVVPVAPEPIGAHRADVLVAAVESVADALPADDSGADRHTIVWHLHPGDVDDDPDGDRPGAPRVTPQVGDASRMRPRTLSLQALARLACQAAAVVALYDDDADLTAIAGRTRRIPPRLMRALRARDRRCRYPGCGATRWLQAHRIWWVVDDGPIRLDNLTNRECPPGGSGGTTRSITRAQRPHGGWGTAHGAQAAYRASSVGMNLSPFA